MRAGLRTGQLGDDVGDRTCTGDPRHGLGHGRHLVVPGRRLVTAGMTMHTKYADWILQEYSWRDRPAATLRPMRALVLTGPGRAEISDVPPPTAGPGDVVVEVARVGLCGTDQELFAGTMPYLASGRASYPLRPGHEWSGVVREIGEGVSAAWLDARVTGDTMLACGR